MPKVRPAWLILIAVVAITAAVPALRDQARLQWEGRRWGRWVALMEDDFRLGQRVTLSPDNLGDVWLSQFITIYGAKHLRFAKQYDGSDPEILLAAGSRLAGSDESDTGLSLLTRATEADGGPATWAVYSAALLEDVEYHRLGTCGADPKDPAAIAETEEWIAAEGYSRELNPEQAQPIVDALRGWQAADPENAFPVALEAWVLYGLHRDAEALDCWKHAARLPTLTSRWPEVREAQKRLHERLGLPRPEAALVTELLPDPSFAQKLRDGARLALFEGLRAQMEGRHQEAVDLWNASISLGRKRQHATEDILDFLVGAAVQAIGAAPAWRWCSDKDTGIPDGPLLKGRYFYGREHAFYVTQVGERTDAELRDRLVAAKLRSAVAQRYDDNAYAGTALMLRAGYLLFIGYVLAAQLGIALAVFLLISAWRRRRADQATGMRSAWKLLIALLAVLPLFVYYLAPAICSPDILRTWPTRLEGAFALPALTALLLCLVAAPFSKRSPSGVLGSWKGNLRQVLPVVLALTALVYLAIGGLAMTLRMDAARKMVHSEIARMAESAGQAWHNPSIPPDSFRAEYPPEQSRR